MAGQEPEKIRMVPRWGNLIYVDGYVSRIVSMKPGKNQKGDDIWDFVLEPSIELIKRYNITAKDLNDEGLYTQSLPYDLIIALNLDPTWTRYFYLRTYSGEETHISLILKGISQQKEIQELKSKLRLQKLKTEVANENLHLAETNIGKYVKRTMSPIISEIVPLINEIVKDTTKPN